jgi:hypothetical protein
MRARFSCVTLMALIGVAAICSASADAADGGEKRYFRADPPDEPAFSLPDPLVSIHGKKITTTEEWKTLRRPEILELFRKNEYGRVPDNPVQTSFKVVSEDANAMSGAATLKLVDVTIAKGTKSLTIHVSLFIPNNVDKPVPTFLLICNREKTNIDPTRKEKSEFWPAEEVIARGYGVSAFHYGDVAPDKFDGFVDGAYALFDDAPRGPDSWCAIAAWAWGASRVMDYFETDKDIARDKVALIGHSRGGKTALWASAQDERFALTISNDSGCSGASLARHVAKDKETVARINTSFPHWFCDNYKSFNNKVDAMPFDQHMLIALIAPRAVSVGSANEDFIADPRGEFLSVVNAAPVFQLFGRKGLGVTEMPALGEPVNGDGLAYHVREGKHNLTLYDWECHMDFADKVFGRKK